METGKGTSVYTVSNHAKERYAERCKDRDSRLEITTYVAEHSQRIEEEINQMLRYGKRVYTGRTEGGKDRVPKEVYVNGLWILLANAETRNVITPVPGGPWLRAGPGQAVRGADGPAPGGSKRTSG